MTLVDLFGMVNLRGTMNPARVSFTLLCPFALTNDFKNFRIKVSISHLIANSPVSFAIFVLGTISQTKYIERKIKKETLN